MADWEEDMVYVKSFFSTNQKNIFDQGLTELEKYEENKAYLTGEWKWKDLVNQLTEIIKNPIPYRKIKDIPELIHKIEEQINIVLSEKKANA